VGEDGGQRSGTVRIATETKRGEGRMVEKRRGVGEVWLAAGEQLKLNCNQSCCYAADSAYLQAETDAHDDEKIWCIYVPKETQEIEGNTWDIWGGV
jgi:phage gp45-like